TKDQLKQELLKKVKEGIKPSDLKNNKEGVLHDFNLPPSNERSPSGFDKPDEGYESETVSHQSPVKNPAKSKVKQLQAQVKFEANKAQSYLTELQSTLAELDQAQQEIQHLQSQPSQLSQETEQAIIEANQKIRQLIKTNEKLQAKNSELNKSMTDLQNQAKNKVKETKTPPQPNKPKQYLFTCDICQQNKRSQLHLSRVNGLGIDPHKQNKICDYCLKKVDIIQEKKEEFF